MNLREPNSGIASEYSWPSLKVLPWSASASARSTTSGLVYQLVEPASSPSPHCSFGHHWTPSGVSILSPSTQGLPAQSCQASGLHSAQATPVLSTSAPALASRMRAMFRTSLRVLIGAAL